MVESPDGRPIFHSRPTQRDLGKSDPVTFAEEQEMAMLYRHQVEFGVGHGVSIHAECPEGVCDRATRLATKVVPSYEIPQTTPPTSADFSKLAGLVLDMKELGETPTADFDKKIRPLLVAYEAWIKDREADLQKPGMAMHKKSGQATLQRCRTALSRIEAGLKLLTDDKDAAEAFRFANLAMWQQRIHTILSQKKRREEKADLKEIDVPGNRSLVSVPVGLHPAEPARHHQTRPQRPEGEAEAVADLLWFPTGGGKTEAYLGLTAYTMGLRRLQGTVAGRSGQSGVAVLMRYTLRLLTIQQFQRATALICACELIRREDGEGRQTLGRRRRSASASGWGRRPRPTGRTTAAEAIQQEHGQRYSGADGAAARRTN